MVEVSENEAIAARLVQLITPKVTELDLFLEKVRVKGSKNSRLVEVFLDLREGDGEVSFERIGEASQEISRLMDEYDPVEGAYNLEVSSLGAEHVLDNPRLFARATGKDAEIKMGGKTRQGKIISAGEQSFVWEENGKQETIPFSELELARTVILFGVDSAPKRSSKSRKKK